MGKLLSDFTAKPKHIPVCFLRIEAGDGGRRRPGSKNEFAAQSKTTQPRRGERKQHRTQPIPAGRLLSAALLGVNRGPGSLPNCLAGMGAGVLLMSEASSWGRPWESGFFFWTGWFSPAGRSDSWACRLVPEVHKRPRCGAKFQEFGSHIPGGQGERFCHQGYPPSTGKVGEKRRPKPLGFQGGIDQGGILGCK